MSPGVNTVSKSKELYPTRSNTSSLLFKSQPPSPHSPSNDFLIVSMDSEEGMKIDTPCPAFTTKVATGQMKI